MKMLLFLGSGVSLESGMPDVRKITTAILDGPWHSASDSNFYPGFAPPNYFPESWVKRHQDFLRLLKKHADEYFQMRRPQDVTYEDLFYLAQQVEDEVRGEIDN